jgi:hypothetical protein
VLVISLIASLPMLAIACYVACDDRRSLAPFFTLGAIFAFGPLLGGLLLPTVVLHFFFLAVAVIAIRYGAVRPARYALPATLAASLAAYAIGGARAVYDSREYERLRELYPLESLVERLPPDPELSQRRPLPSAARARLEELETRANSYSHRSVMLRILHEDTVGLFVNSPGFGVARVMLPSESLLEIDARGVAPVPQPVPRASALNLTPGFVGQPKASPNNEDYNRHWQGVADFTDSRNRGYVRDRQHVAGFRPHRLSEVPGVGSPRMAVETVELVSLLRFSEPAVYISADLPRMDELRDAPTRLLDGFESAALWQLRDGEDLVAVQDGALVRMLGSIRNAKHCLDCHGGARGDLLGAFSYTLKRKES